MWRPSVVPSRLEQAVMQRVKRARLFVWLRQHRHELLDEGFQAELAGMYDPRPLGQPPVPPALLALATILQAYTGVSDDEVLEATVMDRRWQLVLDWMDQAEAPFSKGTLVGFRARLIASELDRRLLERTVELYAQQAGRPAAGKLRAALDASPLWGAGRVEDTINLVGHALRTALGVLAGQQGWGLAAADRARRLAELAGIGVLAGSSVKAALDQDWDDPTLGSGPLACSWPRSGRSNSSPGRWLAGMTHAWLPPWPPPGRSATRTPPSTPPGWPSFVRASPATGGSRSPMARCAMAARPAASGGRLQASCAAGSGL
jgi:Transposase domain (DUF772)